jgi:hypothetical protein
MSTILEVRPLPTPSIVPIRQPRLLLSDPNEAWPEEVWDALPTDVQREVLRQLARLLTRWLNAREDRP